MLLVIHSASNRYRQINNNYHNYIVNSLPCELRAPRADKSAHRPPEALPLKSRFCSSTSPVRVMIITNVPIDGEF